MLVSEFFNKELNSLKFYEDLNFSNIEDDLGWAQVKKFDQQDLYSFHTIDFLTYLLLLNCNIHLDEINLYKLSISYSKKYFELIHAEDLNIELKLKCQRLNYIIQLYLDKHKNKNDDTTFVSNIAFFYPWDLDISDGNIIVIESKDTVRYNNEVVEYLSSANLMFTQVDQFGDNFVFNSCYSLHTAIVNFNLEDHVIQKDVKCMFLFFYKGLLSKISSEGDVFIKENEIGSLGNFNKPWRFRIFENLLFVFDWYEFSSCLIFNLSSGMCRRHTFAEMWIPHDVLRVNDCYWFLDKQQGKIFIYDLNFKFVRSYLGFGYSPGQLCDPIGIKKSGDSVVISSWLSGKINVLNL